MKSFNLLKFALALLLVTGIASYDFKLCRSKLLVEGVCTKKLCNLRRHASEPAAKSTCPVKMASCAVRAKSCGGCEREQQQQQHHCPCCGAEMSPEQRSACPNQSPGNPRAKHLRQPRCPPPGKPKNPPQPKAAKPKCPGGTKTPHAKPKCPCERQSYPMLSRFSFPSVKSVKITEQKHQSK